MSPRRWSASARKASSPSRIQDHRDDLEVVEGLQFDRGYLSRYFVTDTEKMESVIEDPLILITDRKINQIKDLLPILEQVAKAGRPLMIIRKMKPRRSPRCSSTRFAAC